MRKTCCLWREICFVMFKLRTASPNTCMHLGKSDFWDVEQLRFLLFKLWKLNRQQICFVMIKLRTASPNTCMHLAKSIFGVLNMKIDFWGVEHEQ